MAAGALIGGSALGAPFSELLSVVVSVAKKTAKFKSVLKRLESTLITLHPKLLETARLDIQLNHSNEETILFIQQLERGKELILKCAAIQFWNVYSKYKYINKLLDLESNISEFFKVKAQAQLGSISRKTLVGVNSWENKTDQILSVIENRIGVSGLCSIPQLPDFLVGLDLQVEELKGMVLLDGVSVVVISGPVGCGKTTLAKMLCHDQEIGDIFGDNILFVTVSQKANLKIIAKKLFEHQCPERVREFQTDDEAKDGLENLLRQIQSDHILLVLDDVWSESESLIQNLKLQIPGYKILVTSRFVLPSFESTYRMEVLSDDDAKTLFCYSAFPKDGIPNVPDDLVNKIVKRCEGFPLALTVIAASLCRQPVLKWRSTLKKWSEGQSIFDSSNDLLSQLQISIDAVDELPIASE